MRVRVFGELSFVGCKWMFPTFYRDFSEAMSGLH